MLKVQVQEATGIVLDWMVARASKQIVTIRVTGRQNTGCRFGLFFNQRWVREERWDEFAPSSDWSQSGPIIERERIGVWWTGIWHAKYDGWQPHQVQDAHEPLIAAMRCYVINNLGYSVDVPDELV
jgi:Protein of unknown function (DUF2591)